MMKRFLTNFLKCGITGWCIEILYTALGSLRRRDFSLKGITSIWMFPIYGSAALLRPLFSVCKRFPLFLRGSLYAILIFTGEFVSGKLLTKKGICPWSYQSCRFRIADVIRIDYFPNWFLAGLLFEKLLTEKERES